MNLKDFLDLYTERNRSRFLAGAAATIVIIAFVDWLTPPNIGLSFLYAIALILSAGYLRPSQIILLAACCAVLRDYLNPFPLELRSIPRFIFVTTGFSFTGLAFRELLHSRQAAVENFKRIEDEIQRREEAEEQVRIVIESSPAAILVVDGDGSIRMSNAASRKLFAFENERMEGKSIRPYLPLLETALSNASPGFLNVNLEARGRRKNGEPFPANLWISTYTTRSGPKLAAIILDTSEELRNREQSELAQLLSGSQILVGAVSHEVRNLCGAIQIVYMNLMRVTGLAENEDFVALRHLIAGLQNIASAELFAPARQSGSKLALREVLDDLRVVIEPSCRESEIALMWEIPDALPLVRADHHGLLQALLNLVQNSNHAMEDSVEKSLWIGVYNEDEKTVIRVRDTGGGVPNPDQLFQPFQPGADVTGLGLYVSRAIIRAFGGDLRYEAEQRGACFVLELKRADQGAESGA